MVTDRLSGLSARIGSCAQSVASKGRKRCRPAALALELLEPLEALAGTFIIKNTFIEMLAPCSPSLSAFYKQRTARSCPPKRVECDISEVPQDVSGSPLPSPCRMPTPCRWQAPSAAGRRQAPLSGRDALGGAPQASCISVAASEAMQPLGITSPRSRNAWPWRAAAAHCGAGVAPQPASAVCGGSANASDIAVAALPRDPLPCLATHTVHSFASAGVASQWLPPPPPPMGFAPVVLNFSSIGSMGHAAGTCKPCAFLHSKGCRMGPACEYCHLCGPGERKMRGREKYESIKQDKARRMAARAHRAAELLERARCEAHASV